MKYYTLRKLVHDNNSNNKSAPVAMPDIYKEALNEWADRINGRHRTFQTEWRFYPEESEGHGTYFIYGITCIATKEDILADPKLTDAERKTRAKEIDDSDFTELDDIPTEQEDARLRNYTRATLINGGIKISIR